MQTPLTCVLQENLGWYSVLKIFHKVRGDIKCWLYSDSLYKNWLKLSQDC